ncbi:hypothetical protein RJ641_014254, partial [Dillenia turbinata]
CFFGGGTPSLVPPRLVSLVLDTLRLKFGIYSDAELSIEMDPATFDARKMEGLIELGVNRVSLGSSGLSRTGMWKSSWFKGSVDCKSHVVLRIGVWISSPLPHQTIDMWEDSCVAQLKCSLPMSVCDLQVKRGTKFGILQSSTEWPQECLLIQAISIMKSAVTVKRRFQCKHNSTYWEDKSFYGFGLGSASYVGGVRFSRPRKMEEYNNYMQDLEREVRGHFGDDHVDAKDMEMDVVMLSLRTARGLDLVSFGEAFGHHLLCSLCRVYQSYVESGHVVCLDRQRKVVDVKKFKTLVSNGGGIHKVVPYIRLSDPNVFLVSNELISLAFAAMAP